MRSLRHRGWRNNFPLYDSTARPCRCLQRRGFQVGRPVDSVGRCVRHENLVACSHARTFTTKVSDQAYETPSSQSTGHTLASLPPSQISDSKPTFAWKRPEKSEVRARLKAWSKINAEKKASQVPVDLPAEGPVFALPQSLFLDEQDLTTSERFSDAEQDDWLEVSDVDTQVAGSSWNSLYPGDLFTYQQNLQKPQLAVYLGLLGYQCLVLLANGKWVAEKFRDPIGDTVNNFASGAEVAQILEHLPKKPLERTDGPDAGIDIPYVGELSRDITAPILQRIEKVNVDVLNFRRKHVKVLDNAYETLADENYFLSLTADEMSRKLFGVESKELGGAGCIAMSLSLRLHPHVRGMKTISQYVHLPWTMIKPKALARNNDEVSGWLRQYQEAAAKATSGVDIATRLRDNPITAFVDKARQKILESRKLRSPTTIGLLGPHVAHQTQDGAISIKVNSDIYSQNDRKILRFLEDSYVRRPPERSRVQMALATLILRAVGAYPKMLLGRQIGVLLLQEIGSLPPWSSDTDMHVTAPLPGHPGAHELSLMTAELQEEATRLGITSDCARNPIHDPMTDIREDLGQMEAFAIDPRDSKYPEDAISLEASTLHKGLHWIHVHISHVSPFFSPGGIFGRKARAQTTSWYTPTTVHHMLSPEISAIVSIRPPAPMLTTSTLLDENGKVHDIRVRPTTLRNLVRLTHRGVAHALGQEQDEEAYLVVGQDPTLSPKYLADTTARWMEQEAAHARPYLGTLKKLLSLLQARRVRRRQEVPEHSNPWYERKETSYTTNTEEAWHEDRAYLSRSFLGDPTIKLTASRHQPMERETGRRKWNIVELAMVLCGESTGKWLRERDIPAIYDFSEFSPNCPASKLHEYSIDDRIQAPQHRLSVEPKPHLLIATEQYCRVTSPMRRFTDLVIQWNVSAYLRAEAEGLLEGGTRTNGIDFPFSKTEIQTYIENESWITDWGEREIRKQYKHWAFQAFFRAVHFKEVSLPEIWDVRAGQHRLLQTINEIHPDATTIIGKLIPFDVQVVILKSKEGYEETAKKSNYLPCKIEMVDALLGFVLVRPVGPPTAEPRHQGKIEIQSALMDRNVKLRKLADDKASLEEQVQAREGLENEETNAAVG